MTDSLSIGWTRDAADRARKTFQWLLAFNLALQCAVAVVVLIHPGPLLELFGLTAEAAGQWARVWAGMVLLASAFQLPPLIDPIAGRIPALIGIVGRAGMSILFLSLGGGFVWLAGFDALFALLLYLTYRRAIIAELQTRP